MRLEKNVQVVARFQRSVRIDADLSEPAALDGFLCTESFARALKSLAENLSANKQGAFTWTGPYGGGKSVLLLALASLIGPRGKSRTSVERAVPEDLKDIVQTAFRPGASGWLTVPVVGARAPAHVLIWDALHTARLVPKAATRAPSPREVIRTLERISGQGTHGGVLVAIDELGKVLEDAASHSGDLHFLQDLAESASRSSRRLVIVGVLHQAFEDYASRLHKEARDEWAKIQGRFIDIPLSPTGGEQLELLARAISAKGMPKRHEEMAKEVAACIRRYRPDAPKDTEAVLRRCWPLHPVTACLLGPISRRRFGQNQRSLFAFLNSREPQGFQDFLQSASVEEVFSPAQLFDYLQLNFEPAILASPDGHRWSVAIDALERAEKKGATTAAIELLKSVALLDLFRERSGLFATKEVLRTTAPQLSAKQFAGTLEELRQWSVLAYREHINAFAVYAGSDFDLQAALDDAKKEVREPDLKALRQLANLRPIVAKRHYHATGAFRWLDVDIVTKAEVTARLRAFEQGAAFGQVFLLIAGVNDSDKSLRDFAQETTAAAKYPCVIGVCPTASRVTELSSELLELEYIRMNHPQLAHDAVARREVDARAATVAQLLETEIRNAFSSARFYDRGEFVKIGGLGDLTRHASELADRLFSTAPVIINELLNRASPSSNAVAAQKELLRAMVLNQSKPSLGITGYPPERGLYDSILERTGLHRVTSEAVGFVEPSRSATHLKALWKATDKFLAAAIEKPVSAAEVYKLFSEPPFGVRRGLHAILFVAYVLSRLDRYTVYVGGVMESELTAFAIDRLVMEPATLTLRVFDPTEKQRQLIEGARRTLRRLGSLSPDDESDTTTLARALVSIVRSQPPYVLRTTRLSANAMTLRTALRAASDPHVLLHETLPATLQQIVAKPNASLSDLLVVLNDGLVEIASAYSSMLQRLDALLMTELDVDRSDEAHTELRHRAERIKGLTGDLRLEAFAGRLASYGVDAVEGIASLAATKAPRDWTDNDCDSAMLELSKLAEKFKRAEAFARVKGRPDGRHAISFVVGLDRSPQVIARDFEIAERDRMKVLEVARQISAIAGSHKVEVLLAALAQVGSELISSDQGRTSRAVNE